MKSITCTFAVPPRVLSPNARPTHWGRKYESSKAAHRSGAMSVHDAGGTGWGVGMTKIYLDVKWYGKTRAVFSMDRDNALANLKKTLDGAADQMGCDDKSYAPRSMEFDCDPNNPRVEITFTVDYGNG